MHINIISPFLYIIFVNRITKLIPCPKSTTMKIIRKYHNINLSILSFIMLVGFTIGNYQTDKLSSLNNLLCKPYSNNSYIIISANMFLYSKYLEWGDTLFLHLSGKSISMLQYTHHMTTAFLMYANIIDYISPYIYVFTALIVLFTYGCIGILHILEECCIHIEN